MRTNPFLLLFCCLAVQAIGQTPDAGQQFIRRKCKTEHVSLPSDGKESPSPRDLGVITVLGSKDYANKRLYVPFFVLLPGVFWAAGIASVNEGIVRSLRLFRVDAKTGTAIN
jgi:hypothetical protein